MMNTNYQTQIIHPMPSFFKQARGVQKPQYISANKSVHKTIFHVIEKKSKPQSYLSRFLPQNWFFASAPATAPAPAPVSSVFETHDCIWYYGTVYVKESVAVERLQTMQQTHQQMREYSPQQLQEEHQEHQEPQEPQEQPDQKNQPIQPPNENESHGIDDDDDTESVSSSNSNNHNHPRNVGKQNQLKYLSNGMRLKHLILLNRAKNEWNEWCATFDSETNRVIRTDGVAFDTLRQFARLHCNEVLATTSTLNNVWADPHFQYQDADGEWHPLAKLK